MLPKKYRLSLKEGKKKRVSGGNRYAGLYFRLIVYQQPAFSKKEEALPVTQFGFLVSKRVSKKAVSRNRIRRLLEESIRGFLPMVKPGFGVIVLAKGAVEGKSLEEIKKEVEKLFRKASLF